MLRRDLGFLGLAAALLTAALLVPGAAGRAEDEAVHRLPDPARPPRAAVFRAPGFPTVDAPAIPAATLDEALAGLPAETIDSAGALSERLRLAEFDVLVLPHGSAFPLEAWPTIRAFVKGGGGLVVLGGAPLHQPVSAEGEGCVLGSRQPSFAHELLIGPAEPVERTGWASPLKLAAVEAAGWEGPLPDPSRAWALTIRLATRKDMEGEDGSAGPRDGVVRPLVHVVDAEGTPRLCPLLEVDRLQGDDAGARWVLAPSNAVLPAAVIRRAIERALQGAGLVEARPVRATLEAGESALIRVLVRRPLPRPGEATPSRARIEVRSDDGRVVFTGEAGLEGPRELRTGAIRVRTDTPLPPGLYHVEVAVPEVSWEPRTSVTGFWVRNPKLLASGPRLTASRDWLRRDGRVVPVVGTTYMASDVHRKFLFEPNPHAWDRDFRAMARRGVNFVRTGLWTAWSRVMLDPGAVDENVLSALDAYVHTAAKHGIPVCFNFFAFSPPAFGGSNPYLDPRAIEGQRALLTLLAARYRDVPWIHWDLINEPSYAPPDRLWTNQPIGDTHERRAWAEWVIGKHGDAPLLWRDLWREPGDDVLSLPGRDELAQSFLREHRRPRKVRDFAEFSQEVVRGWARKMRSVLQAAGGDVLVTLGQDEGGTLDRPAQQLYYDVLDYTAIHTWWNSDDLLWDGVVSKVPEKANLHQETGLMGLEDLDGRPWRTPAMASEFLERKFAYAIASRGAGVLEWAWNVNPYQPLDNESRIGFFRPDGTAKPELGVVPLFAAFFKQAAPWIDDFEPDPVVLVIPHSRLFSGRPAGVDATKRVVRLAAERFGVVPTALSELRLSAERLKGARLVLVPVPEMLEEGAARALLDASRAGTRVLITGAVEGDPYGRTTESLQALGVVDEGRPVAQHERTSWGGWVTFDGLLTERLRRSTKPDLKRLAGNIWHEPLPLEFAREAEPLAALLGAAFDAAGVPIHPSDTRVVARLLVAPRAVLVVCVNETLVAARRRVFIEGRSFEIPVGASRSRLVLLERGTRKVLAATPGEPVAQSGARSQP